MEGMKLKMWIGYCLEDEMQVLSDRHPSSSFLIPLTLSLPLLLHKATPTYPQQSTQPLAHFAHQTVLTYHRQHVSQHDELEV